MARLGRWSEVLAALDSIAAAPPTSPAEGWTAAQAIAHCAQSVEFSLTAFPQLRSGLFRKTIGALAKRQFLRKGQMSHGRAAPIAGAPAIEPTVTLDDALARARRAIVAFEAHEGALAEHLAYGACTKAEYEALHAMHFADHLSAFER